MSNKSYYMNNNSNNKNYVHDAVKEIEKETDVEDVAVETEVENVVVETEAEDTVEQDETVVGVVAGCVKLNIRKESTKDSEVLCTVPENAVLVIDMKESTNEWYSVITESGCNGYCMKKYVTVSK